MNPQIGFNLKVEPNTSISLQRAKINWPAFAIEKTELIHFAIIVKDTVFILHLMTKTLLPCVPFLLSSCGISFFCPFYS